MKQGQPKKIIEFFGATCPYSAAIAPVVAQLAAEGGVVFEQLEVWRNDENMKKMEALRPLYDAHCGGNMIVPSFYDAEKKRLLCNPASYDDLKQWIFQS